MRKNLATEEQELQYRRLRNQVRRLTKKGKKILEKNIAKTCKTNPKSFWKYAQTKLKTRTGIPDLQLNSSNNITYTKNYQEKADILQEFFSSVFTEETPGDPPYFEKRKYDSELNDIQISSDMVKKKLLKIKVNKSPGPDKIHPVSYMKLLHPSPCP